MFVEKDDLLTVILEDELDEITRSEDTLIDQAIAIGISEARGYLFDEFDVDDIFSKTGDERNAMLLNCCIDIAIYVLVSRCQAGMDLTDRTERYNRAKSWLKMVQKTEIYADLKRKSPTEQNHITYGSNSKRSNYF